MADDEGLEKKQAMRKQKASHTRINLEELRKMPTFVLDFEVWPQALC